MNTISLVLLAVFLFSNGASSEDFKLKAGLYAPDAGHQLEGCNLEITFSNYSGPDKDAADDIYVHTAELQSNPTCVPSEPSGWHYNPSHLYFPTCYFITEKYSGAAWFELQPTSETAFIKTGLVVDQSIYIPYHRVGN